MTHKKSLDAIIDSILGGFETIVSGIRAETEDHAVATTAVVGVGGIAGIYYASGVISYVHHHAPAFSTPTTIALYASLAAVLYGAQRVTGWIIDRLHERQSSLYNNQRFSAVRDNTRDNPTRKAALSLATLGIVGVLAGSYKFCEYLQRHTIPHSLPEERALVSK